MLTNRNFISAVCMARALLEATCHQIHVIYEIQDKWDKIVKLTKNENSGKQFGEFMFEIVQLLERSHTGSAMDWQKHLELGFELNTMKPIHINDILRKVEKKNKTKRERLLCNTLRDDTS